MADGGNRLPVTSVAEIVLTDRQEYYAWRELLGISDRTKRLSLAETLRFAALVWLMKRLGGTRGPLAYGKLREHLADLSDAASLEVAWVQADRHAEVIAGPQELMDLARRGSPVQVVDLSSELARVRSAFVSELEAPRRRRSRGEPKA